MDEVRFLGWPPANRSWILAWFQYVGQNHSMGSALVSNSNFPLGLICACYLDFFDSSWSGSIIVHKPPDFLMQLLKESYGLKINLQDLSYFFPHGATTTMDERGLALPLICQKIWRLQLSLICQKINSQA